MVEEIIVAKERYDYWKSVTPGFCDEGYIWYQPNGRPHARSDYSKPFNALKQKLGLPEDFHWHDLRHAYATIQINSHGVPEFDSFIDEILPSDEPQVIDWAFSQLFLDYVLPNSVA